MDQTLLNERMDTIVGLVLLTIALLVGGGIWLYVKLAQRLAEGRVNAFWADRYRDHYARMAELEAYEAAGELPVRITREYLTSDEFTWEADALEQRGYELAHEPFTSAEGLIVVTYRLEEEPAEEYPVQEYWG
jgi:hypothetical protein